MFSHSEDPCFTCKGDNRPQRVQVLVFVSVSNVVFLRVLFTGGLWYEITLLVGDEVESSLTLFSTVAVTSRSTDRLCVSLDTALVYQ